MSSGLRVALATTTLAAANGIPRLDANSRLSMRGIISAGAAAPTITDVSSTIGSTGTFTVVGNDFGGYIKLNPGGSSIGAYTIFAINWNVTRPSANYSIQFTLEDNAANWGGGSTLSLSVATCSTKTASLARCFARNISGQTGSPVAVNFAAGSDQYRINYHVID